MKLIDKLKKLCADHEAAFIGFVDTWLIEEAIHKYEQTSDWISIYTEADLPKEAGDYIWQVKKNELHEHTRMVIMKFNNASLDKAYFPSRYSAWQPLPKPYIQDMCHQCDYFNMPKNGGHCYMFEERCPDCKMFKAGETE